MTRHFRLTSTIPLRWRDLDAQQHVFHGVHVTLFDQARGRMLASALTTPDPVYAIARLDLEYFHSLGLDDSPVAVTSTIVTIGTTSITTQERMTSRHGTEIACATAVLVWLDETMSKRALTSDERTALLTAPAEGTCCGVDR